MVLRGLTEDWKSAATWLRMGGSGSILPTHRIVANSGGDVSIGGVKQVGAGGSD